jgi:hypothetical protein
MNLLGLSKLRGSILSRVTLTALLFLSLTVPNISAPAFAASTSPALSFDGSSNINMTSRLGVGYYSKGLTMSSWVKTTSATIADYYEPANPIFGDTTGAVGMQFGVSNGVAAYHVYDSGWKVVYGKTKVNDDKWHHIAVTHDYTTLAVRVYLDGVLDAESTSSIYGYGGIGYIGRGVGGSYFTGSLDDVQLWNKALSSDDIKLLPTNPNLSSADLILWYKMDENTGTSLVSSTSGANTGTFVGNPSWGIKDSTEKVEVKEDPIIALVTGHNGINPRVSIMNYAQAKSVNQSTILPYAYANASE